MISYKSKAEIEIIKKSGNILAMVFNEVKKIICPGISTWEINNVAYDIIKENNAIPSFLNYGMPPFPGTICASINEEIVHGIPRKDRLLKEGDIISIDVGAKFQGFHADAARTFSVGEVSKEVQNLNKVTEECFWKGVEKMVIGNRIGDISSAIEHWAVIHGYGVVRELTGHGIGNNLHEEPDVPNYGKHGRGLRIEEGLVLAIEPMINLGTRNVRMLPDKWTIVTLDGKVSSHYENTVVATKDGPIVLTLGDNS